MLLKEELRELYHLPDPSTALEYLTAWLAWASRSKLKPFVGLARTIRRYRDGILATIRLGVLQRAPRRPRLQGAAHRPRHLGLHSADPLIALIYLCPAPIHIDLPFTTNP